MKKILFLADVNSSHTQKWVIGVATLGYNVALFSISAPKSDWFSESGVTLLSEDLQGEREIFKKNDLFKIRYLQFYNNLKKKVVSFSPDIIHSHYATSYGMLGSRTDIHPFVISVWGSDVFDFPNRSFFHKWFLKKIFSKADMILSTSKIMKDEVLKYSDKNVLITPFGIELDKFINTNSRDKDIFTLGIIKSLEKHYGIHFLIEAFRKVTDKYPERKLRLIITGEGTQELKLKQLAIQLKLTDKILFTGKIKQKDVPSMHNKFDVFVCPSLNESFGVSVLEASACEVPVIVTNAGGLKEVAINGETGLMVNPGSTDEIADAISFFIDNPESISVFGKKGRKFVQDNFNWKDNLVLINDIYARL